jgi:hypothetical protein
VFVGNEGEQSMEILADLKLGQTKYRVTKGLRLDVYGSSDKTIS